MNKALTLSAAIIAALAATTATVASADNGKHFGYGSGHGYYRPAYVAPGPVRPYYSPARGYWSGGRWIAPVVVGGLVAAAVGSAAYAYSAPTYTYVEPSYYAPAAVTYVAPARTGFDYADVNGDGYISYDEAVAYPHWQRNFGLIDRNRDGYLSRDEVAGWRYR